MAPPRTTTTIAVAIVVALALVTGACASSKAPATPAPSYAAAVAAGNAAGDPVETSLGVWSSASFAWVAKYFTLCQNANSTRPACKKGQVNTCFSHSAAARRSNNGKDDARAASAYALTTTS